MKMLRGIFHANRAGTAAVFLLGLWGAWITVDRWLTFAEAGAQSRALVPALAGALREQKLDEAIKICDRYKNSHLAKLAVAGLQQYNPRHLPGQVQCPDLQETHAALRRAQVIVEAGLRAGVERVAVIGWTALLAGLLAMLAGSARAMRLYMAGQAADVPGLIAGVNAALQPLILGTFIAIFCFWGTTLLRERADQMDIEMANSTSELLSYFGTLGQGSGHLK